MWRNLGGIIHPLLSLHSPKQGTIMWSKLGEVIQPLLSLDTQRRRPHNTMQQAQAQYESLDNLLTKYEASDDPNQVLTRDQFHTLLQSHLQNRRHEQMDHLLLRMEHMHARSKLDICKPTRETFQLVMRGWIKSGNANKARDKTALLLDRMWTLYNEGNAEAKPSIGTYHIVLDCWSVKRSRDENWESAIMCSQVIHDICEKHDEEDLKPTLETFNYVLEAWSRCTDVRAPPRAVAVLSAMKLMGVEPDTRSFRHLIWTWVRSGHRDAEKEVKRILSFMENQLRESGREQQHPNIDCYNGLLSMYAKRTNQQHKAESLLTRLLQDYLQGTTTIKPDYLSFYTTIGACCKIRDPVKAEKVYRQMLEMAPTLDLQLERYVEIFLRVFTELLECVAKSSNEGFASHTDELLRDMLGSLQTGDLKFVSYKLGGPIDMSLQLKAHTFNVVLEAWARSRSPEKAAKADAVLEKMKEMNVRPTSETYTALLACNIHDAHRAHDLLFEIIGGFERREHAAFPTVHWFNCVLEAWSKTPNDEALAKSNHVFMKMRAIHNVHKYLEPTTKTFEHLMAIVAHQRNPSAAEYWMTDILKRRARDPSIILSTSIFNSIIFAWIWNEDPMIDQVSRVYDIFHDMKEVFHCEPDQYTYQFMLQCLARSNYEDKAQRAQHLVEELEDRGIVPSTRVYNEVLAACAFSVDYVHVLRKSVFVVALKTFRKVLLPDEYTFGYFFKAAADMGELDVVANIYQLCRGRGFGKNRNIVRILEQSHPELFLETHQVEPRSCIQPESNFGILDKDILQGAIQSLEELQSEPRRSRSRSRPTRSAKSRNMPELPEWPLD
jgi:pentatricopeptide repeat protein